MIVAQRIGTIMDADRIVVLDEGRIVGSGRHEELLAVGGVYATLVHDQKTTQASDVVFAEHERVVR